MDVIEKLPIDRVVFTKHAIRRFIERFHPNIQRFDAYLLAHKLLGQAKNTAPLNSKPKKRLIRDVYTEVLYFYHNHYRFIIVEEDDDFFVFVSVERSEMENGHI